jgi:hypothetical protein
VEGVICGHDPAYSGLKLVPSLQERRDEAIHSSVLLRGLFRQSYDSGEPWCRHGAADQFALLQIHQRWLAFASGIVVTGIGASCCERDRAVPGFAQIADSCPGDRLIGISGKAQAPPPNSRR